MKVLAIETSGLVASVAIAEDHKIICEYTTNFKKTHSLTLMPMLEEIKKAVDLDLKMLDLIAVSGGPGSFTGLRIGSATAKGLAHVLNVPIASIPTLEGLANNIDQTDLLICPLMDARRHQVYTAIYEYQDGCIRPRTDMMATEIDTIIEKILSYNKEVIFLGDGFAPNEERIKELLEGRKWHLASPNNRIQRASSIALLGVRYAEEGKLQNYMEHAPIYLRKPQAEREYDEKHK
ncbi:MAG: tRNA (adenosine(37)-N6)-threonylcarbamoyltransferase complex dimerization subunit type 1 TsaB [Firmicutes bacterium HGW-Firmicutes-1]|jgi:tRNA threonylcarbamoyladenosine biosynthesis protein TsaB|nr:MAG: tRNA (adenosine(37)-N6)-threonylcarbamoyltransferase complex dimerization subunit type 1 TsaB [Firmicutes bacterium HGW-Firmicutes-1]